MHYATRFAALALPASLVVALNCQPAVAYTFTFFDVSAYNSNTAIMDATLGVTGYTIEDFEDASLDSGIVVTGDVITVSHNNVNVAWDGTDSLRFGGDPITVTLPIAAGSVGFAISEVNNDCASCTLAINGGTPISLPTLTGFDAAFNDADATRNIYIRIEPEGSDAAISSFAFDPSEGTTIDHIAFSAGASGTPEPSALVLSMLGLVALPMKRRRRRRS